MSQVVERSAALAEAREQAKEEAKAQASKVNFRLGVVNGALGKMGNAFLSPNFVMAAFIYDLTRSNLLVGMVSSLATAGVMWPQLYISSLIEHRPRRKPFYVLFAVLKVAALLLLIGSVWLAATDLRAVVPAAFLISLFAYRSFQGCGNMPFFDLVGRTISPARMGGFFAQRAFFGDLLALVAGVLLVQPILRMFAMPQNYLTLTLTGAFIAGTGWCVFCFARENAEERPPKQSTFGRTVRRSMKRVGDDRNYRLLLMMRLTFRLATMGIAFSVPFARERVGTAEISGVFVSAIGLSRILSSLLWGRIVDTRGGRLCLLLTNSTFLLAPLVALASPHLPVGFQWTAPGNILELNLPTTVFLFSVALMGLGMQGHMTAYNAFTIHAAPKNRLPSYVAFLNTVSFPITFAPALAGFLVGDEPQRLNYVFVFVALSGAALFAFAWMLKEVRDAPAEG